MPEEHDETTTSSEGSQPSGKLTGMLTRDTLRYVPAAIIPAALSIVAASVFTRVFSPDEYGQYALVLAATVIASAVLSGWLQQSILRYLPRFKTEGTLPDFLVKLVAVLLGVSLPIVILLLAGHSFVADRMGAYGRFLVPAVLLVLSELFFLNFGAVFQANLKSRSYSLFKVLNAVLRLSLALTFVFLIKKDVVGLVVAAAAANYLLIPPMMGAIGVVGKLGVLHKFVDLKLVKLFAAYGLPMVGWMLCGKVLDISDRFILGALRGSAEVGIYSANYNLIRMGFELLSSPILIASYPLVMTAWEKGDRDRAPEILTQFTRHYLLAILPFITFIGLFSREIVSIVLGEEFREGYTIVPFVLGGAAVWGLAMIGHKGMEIAERTRTLLVLAVVSAVLNIGLNFVFIPKYGYNGAAFAKFASYLAYPILVYWATKPFIPWRIPWGSAARIVVASAAMAGIMLAIEWLVPATVPVLLRVIVAAAVGFPAYVAILLTIRELSVRELRALRK